MNDLPEKYKHLSFYANTSEDKFSTPLVQAIVDYQMETAEKLILEGADINAPDKWDMTPLMYACSMGYNPLVGLLMNCGADLTFRNSSRETVLYFAVRGNIEFDYISYIFMETIKKDFDINEVGFFEGTTLLNLAIKNGRHDIMELLIQYGANPSIIDKNGSASFDWLDHYNKLFLEIIDGTRQFGSPIYKR